jgi:hypothetical protein
MSVQDVSIMPSVPKLALVPPPKKSPFLVYVLLAIAATNIIVSLCLLYAFGTTTADLRKKLTVLQEKQWLLDAQQVEFGKRMLSLSPESEQQLSSKAGWTQQQMAVPAGRPERKYSAVADPVTATPNQAQQ